MTWAGSDRRKRLPPGWSSTIAPRILARDGHRCYLCGGHATEVDHVERGDDHRDENLGAICEPDHVVKSAREGNEARSKKYRTRREPERHPGILG